MLTQFLQFKFSTIININGYFLLFCAAFLNMLIMKRLMLVFVIKQLCAIVNFRKVHILSFMRLLHFNFYRVDNKQISLVFLATKGNQL